MTLKEISLEEFHKKSVAEDGQITTLFTKIRAYYDEKTDVLGIVQKDKIDGDFNFVCLRRPKDGRYECYDLGHSFKSAQAAAAALKKSMVRSGKEKLPAGYGADKENGDYKKDSPMIQIRDAARETAASWEKDQGKKKD
jgi:hypothetical protein